MIINYWRKRQAAVLGITLGKVCATGGQEAHVQCKKDYMQEGLYARRIICKKDYTKKDYIQEGNPNATSGYRDSNKDDVPPFSLL